MVIHIFDQYVQCRILFKFIFRVVFFCVCVFFFFCFVAVMCDLVHDVETVFTNSNIFRPTCTM